LRADHSVFLEVFTDIKQNGKKSPCLHYLFHRSSDESQNALP
jgi:hypothetical protein